MITLLTLDNLQPQDQQAVADLDHQLNPHRTPLSLADVLGSDTVFLFAYREQQQIVGMATLSCYRVLSGYKGWIEDVVVDQAHRGRGIGRELMRAIMDQARLLKLQQLFLYTEEEKEVAIRMYEGLGFARKNSRLYTCRLL